MWFGFIYLFVAIMCHLILVHLAKYFLSWFLNCAFYAPSSIILAIIFFFWMGIVIFVEVLSYFKLYFSNTILKTGIFFH